MNTDCYRDYYKHLHGCNCQALNDRHEALRSLRGHFQPWLPAAPDARILDLGCGQGAFLSAFHELGFRRMTGVDLGEENVAAARAQGFAVHCVEAGAFLAATTEHFDLVFARDILEHIPRPQQGPLLQQIRARLAAGGRLIAHVPNMASPIGQVIQHTDITHATAFTPESLRQLLRMHGFTVAATCAVAPLADSPVGRCRWLCWFVRVAFLRLDWLIHTGTVGPAVLTPTFFCVAE